MSSLEGHIYAWDGKFTNQPSRKQNREYIRKRFLRSILIHQKLITESTQATIYYSHRKYIEYTFYCIMNNQINYDDIVEALEKIIKSKQSSWGTGITVKNIHLSFEQAALELWADRLLILGKEVFIKAAGIAIMKRQYMATEEDIKQGFVIQKLGIKNSLPHPDHEDADEESD